MQFVGGLPGLRKKGIRWSRQYIHKKEKRREFPKRVKVGPQTIDWLEQEIDDWMAERAAQRDGETA